MSLAAFQAPGRFWRGNLHTHTDRSDGKRSPEAVCRAYAARGYDFLCLSDHFLPEYGFPLTESADPARLTLIRGAELHGPDIAAGEVWHILAVGLPEGFAPNAPGETGPGLAARALAAGAFVALPHPEWYGLTAADAQSIPGAHAVEIYNHTSALHVGKGGGLAVIDALLASGRRVDILACDDAHFSIPGTEDSDAFGGWVMVRAETCTPDALVAALKAGQYYSTQGPAITAMAVVGGVLTVECSPAAMVVALGSGSRSKVARGPGLTRAALPLARFTDGWCRVVVIDADGRHAWSNPVWL